MIEAVGSEHAVKQYKILDAAPFTCRSIDYGQPYINMALEVNEVLEPVYHATGFIEV